MVVLSDEYSLEPPQYILFSAIGLTPQQPELVKQNGVFYIMIGVVGKNYVL
jgi:hypothetical protein